MAGDLTILIVDDSAEDQLLLKRYIKKQLDQEAEIIALDTGSLALAYIAEHDVDCMLLDYRLPDMDGVEVLRKLNKSKRFSVPVVMLTGLGNENVAIEALKQGAYDYINKSDLESEVLIKAISNAMEKSALSRQVVNREKTIKKISDFDVLTGLPNRNKFETILQDVLDNEIGYKVAVIMIDLDRFKEINDTKGHQFGDQVLQEVAIHLRAEMDPGAVLARFGDDEFAALKVLDNLDEANVIANNFLLTLGKPIYVENVEINLSASIGVAVSPYAGAEVSDLIRNADTALYQAKENGKNQYCFFSNEMNQTLSERTAIATELRGAIKNNEMHLVYHPIYETTNNTIFAMEVLCRWDNPRLGDISPEKFVPIAEQAGLISEIGDWIMDTALEQLQRWQSVFAPDLKMTINVSPIQIYETGWLQNFYDKLSHYNIDPSTIIIELTETAIVSDILLTEKVLHSLADHGCTIYLDDFGTGYSSLTLIKQLPISGLKIDKSFVQNLDENADDAVLVKSIIAFAEVLGLKVVTEGVEKSSQLDYIRGCSSQSMVQGYCLSLPLSAVEMEKVLRTYFDKFSTDT